MRKPKNKRLSLVRATLEGELQKLERRIQALAEKAYMIRQQMEVVDGLELTRLEKHAGLIAKDILKDAQEREEEQNAVHSNESEGSAEQRGTDEGTGGTELSNNPSSNPILAERASELPVDK